MLLNKQDPTNAGPFLIHWLILCLALLALGGAIGYSITHEHNRIDAMEQDRLATQAKVVDVNLERQLVALNSALVGIRKDVPYWKAQQNGKAMANLRLQALSDSMPGVRTLHITDPTGTVFASNRKELIGMNFRDREYFRSARQGLNQDMLYISPPFKTVLGVYAVNAVKVVLDARGKFAGIVSSTLDPDYCNVLLNSVLYTPGMRASLIHGDGKIFVEAPARKDLAGMDLAKPGSRYTLHIESGREANVFTTGRAFTTGDERMSAWRTIRPASLLMDKPLMISVNRGMQGIFASWRRDALMQGGLFGALLLVAVFGLSLYQRRQQKYDRLAANYTTELEESEAKYRTIIEDIEDGYNEVDVNGNFTFFNEPVCKMLGYEREELLGMNNRQYADEGNAHKVYQAYNQVFQTGNPVKNFEWQITRKDGTRRDVEVSISLIRDREGHRTGFRGIARDITERKRTEQKLQDTLDSLRKAVGVTIQVMVSAVESRDPYTSGHQTRSAALARSIATEMGLPWEKIDAIRMAGSIHDIGKLSIPAEILSKPTKLSDIEFSLIKEHARKGFEMLKDVESPWPLAEIVYQHHERIDGSGYPRNLKGEDILIEARILSVADVVEAMASHRPYRPGLGIDAALNEVEKNRGIFYDNAVADACLRLFREKGFKLECA